MVGRLRELLRLTEAHAAAAAGRGQIIGVSGEPGIGKTRLVDELARTAEDRGAVVLVGRCYEAADAPALWPWSQIVETLLDRVAAGAVRANPRAHAASIAEVLPDLRARLEVVGSSWYLKPERARFRGFDGIHRLLRAAARSRPIVAILEDVHAADPASLSLLEFCAREGAETPVLLVATFRDCEVEPGSPIARLLARLPGTGRYEEIRLAPLDAAAAETLAARVGASAGMLEHAVERAEGNPLFLIELARSLVEDATTPIPRGVREIIDARVGRLSAPCIAALATAAAIGRTFDLPELEQVLGAERTHVLDWLDEAGARHVVAELPGDIGRYRFSHGLFREGLYARLPAGERATLHARIGAMLERLHHGDIERHLPEIADHYYRGALAGGGEKAFDYAVAAGHAAAARHAYEEAVAHYDRAEAAWRFVAGRDEAQRCGLLIDLASAEQYAGNRERAVGRFREAVTTARRLRDAGDPQAQELFGRAAFGLAHWGSIGVLDTAMTTLLEEALGGLGGDSALRARLLTRTAAAYYWSDAADRRDRLSAEAVAIARRVGDDRTLAYALAGRHLAIWQPDALEEQLALAEEAIREGVARRDSELQLTGLYWRFLDLLQVGDAAGARRDLRRYARIAERLRQPYFQWNAAVPQATFAMLEGRLEEGERLAGRAFDLGRSMFPFNAQQSLGIQLLMLGRLRGTEEYLLDPVREFIDAAPGIPAWRGALASLYATLGRDEDAARELDVMAARGIANLPRDANYLVGCALVAEACAMIDEPVLARRLYDMMLPYASRSVIVANCAAHFGVVSHYLGLLAATLGRGGQAAEWFADALARYESMGAAPFVARVLVDRTAASLRRGGVPAEGGRQAALAALDRAHELAQEIGMRRWADAAEALRSRVADGTAPDLPADTGCVFRRDGDHWTLAHRGVVARIRDAKGLGYLHHLLRAPGHEFHALDLVAGASDVHAPRRGGDAGPLLDAQAKAEYRRRIAELRAELAEAEDAVDAGRAARARAELDALGRQLGAAVGLGGRDRRAADSAERARLNVTRAIRRAIRQIRLAHPRVARHLAASVVTGRFCRYESDRENAIDWRF